MQRHKSGFFFWRSVLGGVVGIFLLFLYLVYEHPHNILATPYLPLILGLGGLLGGLVAFIILTVRKIFGVELGLIPRSLIGILIPALAAWFYFYNKHETDFAGNPSPQSQIIIVSLVFGLAVGLLSGILAGRVRKYHPSQPG